MLVKYKIITIDGPAGSGKSTIAKALAKELGFFYFDTGLLYRSVTWKIVQENISLTDHKGLDRLLKTFSFHIKDGRCFVGDVDVTSSLRTNTINKFVSEVSAIDRVRDLLKPIQIAATKRGDVVFEGRDLGTIIFPHADLKFFLTARIEVRTERRCKEENQDLPKALLLEEVVKNIQVRDQLDSTRPVAPLQQAQDAVLIDSSDLTIQEVVDMMRERYIEMNSRLGFWATLKIRVLNLFRYTCKK